MGRGRRAGGSGRRFTRPVIAKTAIEDYLSRELDSVDWVKKLPRPELQWRVRHRFAQAGFNYPVANRALFLHQLACIYVGTFRKSFLFFLDMGLGKTQIILSLFAFRKSTMPNLRMLVSAPFEITKAEWQTEVENQTGFTCHVLEGSSAEKYQALMEADSDIFVGSIGAIRSLLSTTGRGKQKVDHGKARRVASRIKFLTIDESQDFGNSESLTFRSFMSLSKYCPFRYSITGTPFGRDPRKVFPQFLLIDRGQTFGTQKEMFTQAFFNASPGLFGGTEFSFKAKEKLRFYRMQKNSSLAYKETECFDVKKAIRLKKMFSLPQESKKAYTTLLKEHVSEEQGGNFHRMRKLTSGYFELQDGTIYEFDTNPKLDMLLSVLATLGQEKVIVFVEYHSTGHLLEAALSQHKYSFIRIYGETKDSLKALKAYKEDPKKQVLLLANKIGARGLNLQVARHEIFYETPVTPDDREQAEKRVRPRMQTKRVRYIDLVCKSTVDETLLGYIAEGRDLREELIHGKTRVDIWGNLK